MLRNIDQIRRRFLWHGHKDQQRQLRGLYTVNWKLVTRPRKLGGLGIRDIQIANWALLTKWMWQWHERRNEWWKRATIVQNDSDRPWHDPNGSPFWKDLTHIAPVFDCSVAYQIGNGSTVKFWHNNWQGIPLKYTFPTLYQAARDKFCSVQHCKTNNSWHLRFHTLLPNAQAERDRLLLQLQGLDISQQPDNMTWLRHPIDFSVNSVYQFISQTPSPISTVSKLWQIGAPLRVSVFAWLMLNNRLTMIDNLVKRGWHLPNICMMCRADQETAQHIFQECTVATEIRTYIYATFGGQYSLPPKFNTLASIELLTDSIEKMNVRQIELVTSFILWQERCHRIIAVKTQSHISLVREIRMEHAAWFTDKGK